MTIASTTPSQRLAAEVRAQMARCQPQKKANDLARLFKRTWHYAKTRYDGDKSYTFDELMIICDWLGVELEDLYRPETAAQQVRRAS